MRYYTKKGQVPLGPGLTLAFQEGKGYYAKGGGGAGTSPVSQSLYDLALRLARSETQPTLDAINAERDRVSQENDARIKNTQGFAAALAKMYGEIAPSIDTTYKNAAGLTDTFGKGFSEAEQHLRENESTNLESFLQKAGIDQGNIDAAVKQTGVNTGLSDVEYGTMGYFPAAGLAREGAAFTAAAKHLPALAGGQGLEATAQLGKAASDSDLQYGNQLISERGKIPALAQQLLNDMLNRQQQQESIDIQRQYLGNTTRSTTASITGVDPVTGQPVKGYHVNPKSGRVEKDVPAGTSSKSVKARETAFSQAQPDVFDDAKALYKPATLEQKAQWLAARPGQGLTLADAPQVMGPEYASAAKQLFDKYKYLLRFATQSGQSALKRRLNQIIRDALSAQGIHPAAKTTKRKPISLGPSVPGIVDRPGG